MTMHLVGHHLQVEAMKRDLIERDWFARTAFNRYYYHMYLKTRESLANMNFESTTLNHSSCSKYLKGQVKRDFEREKRNARKNSDWQLCNDLRKAISSLISLGDLLMQAKAIREVADYGSEVEVDFISSKRFSISNTDVTKMHKWGENVESLCDFIVSTWNKVNV